MRHNLVLPPLLRLGHGLGSRTPDVQNRVMSIITKKRVSDCTSCRLSTTTLYHETTQRHRAASGGRGTQTGQDTPRTGVTDQPQPHRAVSCLTSLTLSVSDYLASIRKASGCAFHIHFKQPIGNCAHARQCSIEVLEAYRIAGGTSGNTPSGTAVHAFISRLLTDCDRVRLYSAPVSGCGASVCASHVRSA